MRSPALRSALAGPAYAAWRIARAFGGGATGLRVVVLHATPEDRLAPLDRLIGLAKRDHDILSPEEAAARLSGGPGGSGASRPACLFSFDDGFASNHRAARQVLARHGVRALFFVCPGLVDLAAAEQRARVVETVFAGRADSAPADIRLMSWAELAELASWGHVVGAHGLAHRRLAALSGAELEREVVGSGEAIAARLGGVEWFAYPFGDIASISAEALAIVGRRYRFCRSGVRGANGGATHRLALFADPIDLAAPAAYQRLALEGGLDFLYADARRRLLALARAAG